MIRFLLIFFFTIGFGIVNNSFGQMKDCKDILIEKKKPSVYVNFVKFGERTFRYSKDSKEGVWLRLNNNSKWDLLVSTIGTDKKNGDFELFYKVGAFKDWFKANPNKNVPTGLEFGHIASEFNLKSGKSIVFSVPREHLYQNLYIVVKFDYDWENNTSNIGHQVLFSSSQLPKETKGEKSKNRH